MARRVDRCPSPRERPCAQIGGLNPEAYLANNVTATKRLLDAAKLAKVSYLVHISSSVVNSAAVDDYTESKKAQEKIALEGGIPCSVLRPTLMFGWFDRKHLARALNEKTSSVPDSRAWTVSSSAALRRRLLRDHYRLHRASQWGYTTSRDYSESTTLSSSGRFVTRSTSHTQS